MTLHLIGTRWHVEGAVDVKILVEAFRRGLNKLIPGKFDFLDLRLIFIGPEMIESVTTGSEEYKKYLKDQIDTAN